MAGLVGFVFSWVSATCLRDCVVCVWCAVLVRCICRNYAWCVSCRVGIIHGLCVFLLLVFFGIGFVVLWLILCIRVWCACGILVILLFGGVGLSDFCCFVYVWLFLL